MLCRNAISIPRITHAIAVSTDIQCLRNPGAGDAAFIHFQAVDVEGGGAAGGVDVACETGWEEGEGGLVLVLVFVVHGELGG